METEELKDNQCIVLLLGEAEKIGKTLYEQLSEQCFNTLVFVDLSNTDSEKILEQIKHEFCDSTIEYIED
jgi:hypothetical protein